MKGRVLWVLLGGALFGLYLHSAYPTLSPYRDSGDLASAALTLGVAHPPGYPLYMLLGRLWLALFPLGNVAFKLHVLSALSGVAACLVAGQVAGPAAFLLLGLAPAFWHLALVSEMYALNALLAAAVLALGCAGGDSLSCGRTQGGGRRLYAAGLLLGLGLANHQTLAAVLLALLWVRRREGPRRLAGLGLFLGLGLLLYAYLPLRSMAHPVLDWGEPRAWRNLLRVLTRADYGGTRLHPERPSGLLAPAAWAAGLPFGLRLFGGQLGAAGCALALWGAWCGRRTPLGQAAALAFALSGPLFIVWANLDPGRADSYPILEPHLVLPLVFAAVLAGLGAIDLSGRAGKKALAAVLAALWLLPPRPVWANVLCRGDFSAWDFGSGLLDSLGSGALLLDPDDPTAFTLGYLSLACGRRPDVTPLMYFRTRWGYEQLRRRRPELAPEGIRSGPELYDALVSGSLAAGRPLYVDLPQKTPPGRSSSPHGLAYRVLARPSEREGLSRALALPALLRVRRPPGEDFFGRHAFAYWTSALNNLGLEAARLRRGEAASLYRRALAADSGMAEAWNNLGNAELGRGDAAAAEGCYRLSVRIKPSPAVIYNLGRVYFLEGRYPDAEAQYRRALEAADVPDAANDLGLVYFRTGKDAQALRAWEELLARHPGYAPAYYNLGLAYEKSGRRAEALEAMRRYGALASDPADKAEAERWLRRHR